jgi:hypothetical protein
MGSGDSGTARGISATIGTYLLNRYILLAFVVLNVFWLFFAGFMDSTGVVRLVTALPTYVFTGIPILIGSPGPVLYVYALVCYHVVRLTARRVRPTV